jgi:hypothetical protein
LIDEMATSGMTQRKWCEANGINYNTIKSIKWKDRVAARTTRITNPTSNTCEPGFIKLKGIASQADNKMYNHNLVKIHIGQVTITIEA